MANSAQSRKRAVQAETRRQRNASQRSTMRTQIKKALSAIAQSDKEGSVNAYQKAVVLLDRAANKGLIHKNKAARHKSRINAKIRALA